MAQTARRSMSQLVEAAINSPELYEQQAAAMEFAYRFGNDLIALEKTARALRKPKGEFDDKFRAIDRMDYFLNLIRVENEQ